jgi:SAM-dependent methyltransferase
MNDFDPKTYWETRLRNRFDLHGVGSIGRGKWFNTWLYRVRKFVFLREMRRLRLPFSEMRVLDIGSGTGFYITCWKQLGVPSVSGSDLTEIVVEKLSERFPGEKFYQVDIGGDISTLGQQQFDMVSAFDVLFHIVDDSRFDQAIGNVYRLLKPGGYFVFSENFLHRETVRARHIVSRSLVDITAVVKNAGFEIIDRVPMFVVMNYPVDSNSRLAQLMWRGTTKIMSVSELLGCALGAVLYPLELLCVSTFKESPATEMMICRKPD